MNVRFNYRYLVGLCLAAASFSALSAIRDAPIKIGDTTYFEVERGVKLKGGDLAKYQQNTMKLLPNEREIYQRQTSKIVVDAHKVSAPVQIESKWSASKVQGAVKKGIKSAINRGNAAFFFGNLALDSIQYLLDSASWNLDKAGNLTVFDKDLIPVLPDDFDFSSLSGTYNGKYPSSCPLVSGGGNPLVGWYKSKCYYSTDPDHPHLDISRAVSSSDVDALDLSSFSPQIQDIPSLSNYLGTPDQVKFSNISEFQGESKTFTYTDENGDTITKQVNTWHNFAVSPSTVTSSSGDPKLEVSTKTQTDTYKDGQKTSSKTETETTKPSDNEDKPTFVGGGGSGKETPTDCAFFPTLCEWLDWTKQPLDDEPDLNKIINDADDFEREYKITGGAASCPAPYKLTIPFFAKTFDVSYQPFCDFATYLRYLFLAFCYFTAARYVVRSI